MSIVTIHHFPIFKAERAVLYYMINYHVLYCFLLGSESFPPQGREKGVLEFRGDVYVVSEEVSITKSYL